MMIYPDILNKHMVVNFPQIDISIPIKNMLIPLQNNIIEIDTINTTRFDGECDFFYRCAKYEKIIEVDVNVKIQNDVLNFVYGVNGGRRFYKFRITWLNKHKKPLIVDIITIINRLRLQSDYEKINVIDVNIEKINKLKQGVDLITSKSN